MSNDVKLEPEAIWLSPRCDAEAPHGEGRSWANPAPEAACDDCGLPWVRYVRADLASHQPQREAGFAVGVKPGDIPPSATVVDPLATLATPAPAVSTDDAIEQIVVGFSDKAILRLDIEEDDPRLSRVCDDMRQTVRAILSRLRGEG